MRDTGMNRGWRASSPISATLSMASSGFLSAREGA
jgi:hypothetical protein